MELEKQVCSLELSKKLKELGVKQSSLFFHLVGGIAQRIECLPLMGENWCSAFTVAELGEMLPDYFDSGKRDNEWLCRALAPISSYINSDTEADARAEMLIHLIENKLIEIET